MENMEIVSIIIPVYGVEKYLAACLDSVCGQTYRALEILVIDDESPDQSGAIADRYAQMDERIKVLHIRNRGAAGARNTGLDVAAGQYIMFVDSDDWLEKNAVEVLVKHLKENSADFVQCQYIDEYVGFSEEHQYIDASDTFSEHEFLRRMIKQWEYVLLWNKLIKRDLLEQVRLVEGRCIDDEFFTYRYVMLAQKVTVITNYLYHYRMRKSGAMQSENKKSQRLKDQVDFVTERYPVLSEKYPDLEGALLEHLCEVLMSVMRRSGTSSDIYRYAKEYLKQYGKKAKKIPIDNNMRKSIFVYTFKRKISEEKDQECAELKQNDFYE